VPGVEQANQYLLRSFGGPNGPDVAVLYAEDAASEPGGQVNWRGDHGGSAWESEHIPLVFSGPGFRQGYVSQQPARLIDIAPTALWALNIPATGMHGVALVDSRTSSPGWAQTRENVQGAALRPIVSALQAESRLELAAHR
jgi:arylsulfatase A-like enzyme